MRFQFQRLCVTGVHLQPRIRRHAFEDRDLACLRTRVPVLNGSASIEDERKLLVWLFGKRAPLNAEKLREEELEEARAIQSVMLPGEPLRAGAVRISHEFQPVAAVGGDFLDYFELADGSIGLYLGDVSGKGLAAAMYAALAVGTLRGVHKTGQSPGSVLSTLNRRLLVQGVPRRYSAAQYAIFDPRTAEMHVTSAGMPGPFHLSAEGCRVLEIPGLPPGGCLRTQSTILRS